MAVQERLPTFAGIMDAARRIEHVANKTPLVHSPALSRRFGAEIYLKLECFQPIRVFKIRGAYNKISRLEDKEVVAISSGNHGLAVAYCSRLLGKKATIVLPEMAVPEKVASIVEYGGKIVKVKDNSQREETARKLVEATGAAMVHPFNDPYMIEGNGTCGLEVTDQLDDFDSVIVPIGGGGLISGIGLAIKFSRPSAKVIGVEPIGAPKMQAALKAGHPVAMESKSVADGLIPSSVGNLTLECCKAYVDDVLTVSDNDILSSVKLLMREAHIFVEPSGAASTAVLQSKPSVDLGRKIVLVVSGGNLSLELLSSLLAQG